MIHQFNKEQKLFQVKLRDAMGGGTYFICNVEI